MFNTRLIREEDANLCIETLTQLIQKHGPVKRPKVPSPLHKSDYLYRQAWSDTNTRPVTNWAYDNFVIILSECGMADWPIELYPLLPNMEAEQLTDGLYDNHGNHVIFYDPDRCHEAGYFTAHVTLKLAEFLLSQNQSDYIQSSLVKRLAILSAACYNRQGFNLMNLTPYISEYMASNDEKPIPPRLIENTLYFTSVMALRITRQSNEQIIATYGQLIPKASRKKVAHAYQQIEAYSSDIKLMQIMNEPHRKALSSSPVNMPVQYKKFGTA